MQIFNPATGEVIQEVDVDDESSIREKVQRAHEAQSAWAARTMSDRASVISDLRGIIVERTDELALTLTREVGKPLAQAKGELRALLARIDFFLEATPAELEPEEVFRGDGVVERITHEPLGVVTNVSAWNYPYFVGGNVFLPALLTGNAVLYKPSEIATLTGQKIERALRDAGLPDGVFTAVVGDGDVGARLVQQRTHGVFFTGSNATGKKIAAAVAPRMLALQLELGGKDPAYVCDDVDVSRAAQSVADGAFFNNGQGCCAVERIYVHERIWDEFVAAFVETVRGFELGDPENAATYLGPLARREAQLEVLEQQVADARRLGGKVLLGGQRVQRPGFFFEPTVIVDVDHEMSLMRDETFGPLIGLMPVASDDVALERMADTAYGLTASVYSVRQDRAERILGDLPVGSAYWNCCDRVSPRLPWSGRGASGVGCTLSTYGIEAFLSPKAWHLREP